MPQIGLHFYLYSGDLYWLSGQLVTTPSLSGDDKVSRCHQVP